MSLAVERAGTRKSSPASRSMTHGPIAIALALSLLASTTAAQLPSSSSRLAPLSPTQRAVHLLNRTTYGARTSDVEALVRLGRDQWLELQLHPERIADEGLAVERDIVVERANVVAARMGAPMVPLTPATARISVSGPLAWDKLARAVYTPRQLEEVMTDFWFNHFNVDSSKQGIGPGAAGHYENNAIRPHVFGRFEDMLLAVASHAAMLIYLDNYVSTTPWPDVAGGGGINENYARELLELHSVGVDGGYTQQDVIEVARAFTGWSVLTYSPKTGVTAPIPGTILMEFHPEWHDAGPKVVLGHTLAADRGIEDGREVIALLARHPSTAEHVATKLVRHFVADDPPQDLVRKLADVFLATDGDLREVTRALFTSEEFYRPEYYRAKVKRPFELLTSTLRLTDARPVRDRTPLYFLGELGQPLFLEAAPTGYPSTADEWMGAGAVIARVGFGLDVAAGRYLQSPIDPWRLLGAPQPDANADVSARYDARRITNRLCERLLPGTQATTLAEATVRDLEGLGSSDPPTLVTRALGLLLGSPEFQRY